MDKVERDAMRNQCKAAFSWLETKGTQLPISDFFAFNKFIFETTKVLDALDEMIARAEKAENSLIFAGYSDNGGELWEPPLGKASGFDALDSAGYDGSRLCEGLPMKNKLIDFARLVSMEIARENQSEPVCKLKIVVNSKTYVIHSAFFENNDVGGVFETIDNGDNTTELKLNINALLLAVEGNDGCMKYWDEY